MQDGVHGSLHTYIHSYFAVRVQQCANCVKSSVHTSVISMDTIECTSCVGAGTGTCSFVGYTVPLLTPFPSTILSGTDTGYCFMTGNCCFVCLCSSQIQEYCRQELTATNRLVIESYLSYLI